MTESRDDEPQAVHPLAAMAAAQDALLARLVDADPRRGLPPVAEALDDLSELPMLADRMARLMASGTRSLFAPMAAGVCESIADRLATLAEAAQTLRDWLPGVDELMVSGADTAAEIAELDAHLGTLADHIGTLATRVSPGSNTRPMTLTRVQADLQVGFTRLTADLRGRLGNAPGPRDNSLPGTVAKLADALTLAAAIQASIFLPPAPRMMARALSA